MRSAVSGCSRAARSATSGSRSWPSTQRTSATAVARAADRARSITSPSSASVNAPYPLSSSRSSGRERRTELSANGRSTSPIAWRWPTSMSTIRRHSGYMSIFVTATSTGGPAPRALARNSSSGPDSSAEASVTNTSASADGRNARVAAACPALSPPTPGVSTSVNPLSRIGLGRRTSTRSTSGRPSRPAPSRVQSGTAVGSIGSRTGSPSTRRWTTALGVSP